jgi:hypothetical protein
MRPITLVEYPNNTFDLTFTEPEYKATLQYFLSQSSYGVPTIGDISIEETPHGIRLSCDEFIIAKDIQHEIDCAVRVEDRRRKELKKLNEAYKLRGLPIAKALDDLINAAETLKKEYLLDEECQEYEQSYKKTRRWVYPPETRHEYLILFRDTYAAIGHMVWAKPDKKQAIGRFFENELLSDAYSMHSMAMSWLAWHCDVTRPECIASFINHKDISLGWHALEALGNTITDKEYAISRLKEFVNAKSYYRQGLAIASLIELGSTDLLPLMKERMFASKTDLSGPAISYVATFEKENAAPLYIRLLKEQRYWEVKMTAMHLLCSYGDERAFESVIERIKKYISKPRSIGVYGRSEITYAIEFLHRFRNSEHKDKVYKTYDAIIKKSANLDESERVWIADHVEYFAQNKSFVVEDKTN